MIERLTNRILSGLNDADLAPLAPFLHRVALSAGERLLEAGDRAQFVYFPKDSIISCHTEMQDGKSAEVGMIGFEGAACITELFSSRPAAHSFSVSIAGNALRIRKEHLERQIVRAGVIQSLLTYTGEYVAQVSQRAACARLHMLEQRLALWLLLVADRRDSDVIETTHDQISRHLGVRRAGVGAVATQMQAVGAIRYKRGRLCIKDRQKLEAMTCECYETLARISVRRLNDRSVPSSLPFQSAEQYRSQNRSVVRV